MITIKDKIKVEVNEKGGCLNSIQKDGYEYQWQGSEDSWTGKDVAIFPWIARLKDGNYFVDGKEYSMKNHGLCRYATLNVVEQKGNKVTLELRANEETLKQYPFKFIFNATYEVKDTTLYVTYKVTNIDDKDIYFGIGGHPAFNIPFVRKETFDDIKGNRIEFEKEINPNNYYLDPTGSFIVKKDVFKPVKVIDLDKAIFQQYKTLMFCDAKMDKVTLYKADGKNVKMRLHNPRTVAIWTKEYFGGYICIEPWNGIPDLMEPEKELSKKAGINTLKPGEIYNFGYEIEI